MSTRNRGSEEAEAAEGVGRRRSWDREEGEVAAVVAARHQTWEAEEALEGHLTRAAAEEEGVRVVRPK